MSGPPSRYNHDNDISWSVWIIVLMQISRVLMLSQWNVYTERDKRYQHLNTERTKNTHTQKGSIFWDITPFSLLKVNRRFGATCRLLLPASCRFLLGSYFNPEDGGDMFLRKVGSHSSELTALYPKWWNSSKTPLRKPQTQHRDCSFIFSRRGNDIIRRTLL
jgi:hypothetical protein